MDQGPLEQVGDQGGGVAGQRVLDQEGPGPLAVRGRVMPGAPAEVPPPRMTGLLRHPIAGGASRLEERPGHPPGDACQCVSPLAEQGASLALAGEAIRTEGLDRSGDDIVHALARYEESFKPGVAKKQGAGHRIAKWFVPATHARLAFRDLMLRASSWPLVAALLRRGLGSDSLLLIVGGARAHLRRIDQRSRGGVSIVVATTMKTAPA